MPHTGSGDGACVHAPNSINQHTGIMNVQLDTTDKEPDANATGPFRNECNTTSVNQWYRDNATFNQGHPRPVPAPRDKAGAQYIFDSSNDSITTAGINCGDGTNSCNTIL